MAGKFIEVPHLPKKPVKYILIDYRAEDEIINNLHKVGISVIKTVKCKDLYEAVQGHPDMVLSSMGDGNIIISPNVFDYYNEKLTPLGLNVIKGNRVLKSHYPYNIAYNICIVGNFVIHNFKYTDEMVMKYIEERKFIKIQVSQGYTKCSIAVIEEGAIITSDIGIHREVIKFGIDSLLIEEGGILLPGLNYGFIGGCCGYINNKDIGFIGDLYQNKNYAEIIKFIKKYKKNILNLGNGQLKDYGSLIAVLEMD